MAYTLECSSASACSSIEHGLSKHGERRTQIYRSGALSDATFLIDERDDSRQC